MVDVKMNDNELIAYHYLRSGPDAIYKAFGYSYKAAETFLQEELYDEFFRNIANSITTMNTSDRTMALHKLISRASNKMRSTMLASVVKISSNTENNDTFYGRFTKYISCRRNNGILVDNSIRKHQYIMDRLQELKSEVSSKLPHSPMRNNINSNASSKSFFQSFKSPSKSPKLFSDVDNEFVI
jgi:hypothetical protein